jgi:hypothetical protein
MGGREMRAVGFASPLPKIRDASQTPFNGSAYSEQRKLEHSSIPSYPTFDDCNGTK